MRNEVIVDSGALCELEGSLDSLLDYIYQKMDEQKDKLPYKNTQLRIRFTTKENGLNPGGNITVSQCYEIYYERK
jgi:hypothetical protein